MLFAIYKPIGISSNGLLNNIRHLLGTKRVGHAGTLDPLASGVLVVATRDDCTKLTEVVGKEKEYLATVKFGFESSTDDEEGEKRQIPIAHIPNADEVYKAVKKFVGEIDQIPPIYSAVKQEGIRAYANARKGKVVTLPPRRVTIKEIDVLSYSWPLAMIRVVTGPGTYIRALARDLGRALETGAYLTALERTRVGQFTKETAVRVEDLERFLNK